MKSGSFFSSIFGSRESELALMFDIESTRVRGILTFVQKGRVPIILGIASKHVSTRNHTHEDHPTRQAGILLALKEVSKEISHTLLPSIDPAITQNRTISKIDYILSSPWSFVRTRTITEEYDRPHMVSDKDIQRILEHERADFETLYTEGKFADTFDFDLEFIEEYIVDIRQNGYSVPRIEKAAVRKLEVSYISGIASGDFLKAMRKAVHEYIHAPEEHVHSSLVMQYTALRHIVKEEEYMWVHIHGGVTDIISVIRSVPKNFATLPYGLKHVTEKVAHSLKVSSPIAESVIRMHSEGYNQPKEAELAYGTKKESAKIEHSLELAGADWFKQVLAEFRTLNEVSVLPAHVLVWAHERSSYFAHHITRNELPADIVARDRLKTDTITFGFVENYVGFHASSHKSLLVGMYAIALYNHMLK